MHFVLQVALTFFLIQFLVVLSIMVVALVFAQPEVPVFSREACWDALTHSFGRAVGLPRRAVQGSRRLVRLVHAKLSPPAYRL